MGFRAQGLEFGVWDLELSCGTDWGVKTWAYGLFGSWVAGFVMTVLSFFGSLYRVVATRGPQRRIPRDDRDPKKLLV